jgi:hypothetical protein
MIVILLVSWSASGYELYAGCLSNAGCVFSKVVAIRPINSGLPSTHLALLLLGETEGLCKTGLSISALCRGICPCSDVSSSSMQPFFVFCCCCCDCGTRRDCPIWGKENDLAMQTYVNTEIILESVAFLGGVKCSVDRKSGSEASLNRGWKLQLLAGTMVRFCLKGTRCYRLSTTTTSTCIVFPQPT